MKNRVLIKQVLLVIEIPMGILLLTVLAHTSDGEPFCLIKRFFGVPCPGCGISRGISAIIGGHFVEALKYNLLSYPVVIASVVVVFWNMVDLIRRQDTYLTTFHRIKIGSVGFVLLVILTIANWLYNIHMGL